MRPFFTAAMMIWIGLVPRLGFSATPFIATESAVPIEQNRYRAEASLSFAEFQYGQRQNDLSLSIVYGLIHNLEIGANLPYLFAKRDARHQDQMGDLNFTAKVLFLKGRDASPISMAGAVNVKLPSASPNRIVDTTGEADTRLSLMVSKTIFSYKAHLNISHTYIGNPPREDRSDRRDYAVGVEYTTTRPGLFLTGELLGKADIGGASAHEQWSLAGGASYPLSPQVKLDGALAFGLSNPAPDFTIHLQASYFF